MTSQQLNFSFFKLPPYTLAGFELSAHMLPSGDDTTRPRRQGAAKLFLYLATTKIWLKKWLREKSPKLIL
jgi:hypothetical protein